MQLVWRAEARRDLREILGYIADRSPAGARRIDDLIARTVEFLTINPYLYRPGRIPGTREAVAHANYVIVYKVAGDRISILSILHARQQYP